VPAAFTAETGRDHWTTLLRARAIENQCYVLAPNQFGRHFGERRCYGRSAIIDPWGTVLAQVPDGVGVACAELELDKLLNLRQRFPCLQHRRL
jgi:predicted amidohydrolase